MTPNFRTTKHTAYIPRFDCRDTYVELCSGFFLIHKPHKDSVLDNYLILKIILKNIDDQFLFLSSAVLSFLATRDFQIGNSHG